MSWLKPISMLARRDTERAMKETSRMAESTDRQTDDHVCNDLKT